MIEYNNQEHEFAIRVPAIPVASLDKEITLTDVELIHRITRVLRLSIDDQVVFFDATQVLRGIITKSDKRCITLIVKKIYPLEPLKPEITVVQAILKREAFEDVLYSCVELGANTIQPLITQKIHKNWLEKGVLQRLDRVMTAAAEQSKQFVLPHLQEPITLATLCTQLKGLVIFFDAQGTPFNNVIQELITHGNKEGELMPPITLIIGPEGDFTAQEKEVLRSQKNILLCALTPTVLRAPQALVVALGMVRSLLA